MAAKPKRITPVQLTDDALALLVDEAVIIDRQIRELEESRKSFEDKLLSAAMSRKSDDGEKTESGGWTVELSGHDGNVISVTQAGPSMATLDAETYESNDDLGDYYEEVVKYKPFKDALERMKQELGKDRLKQLKTIIQKAGSIRIGYKTKAAAVKPVGH